jgi:hypothetical protein
VEALPVQRAFDGDENGGAYIPIHSGILPKPKVAHPTLNILTVDCPNLSKLNCVNSGQRSLEGKMLSKKENDRLMIIYDSLLQLYVLREQACRVKNFKQQDILNRDIMAVESRWQALREKRKGHFN